VAQSCDYTSEVAYTYW